MRYAPTNRLLWRDKPAWRMHGQEWILSDWSIIARLCFVVQYDVRKDKAFKIPFRVAIPLWLAGILKCCSRCSVAPTPAWNIWSMHFFMLYGLFSHIFHPFSIKTSISFLPVYYYQQWQQIVENVASTNVMATSEQHWNDKISWIVERAKDTLLVACRPCCFECCSDAQNKPKNLISLVISQNVIRAYSYK